MASLSGVKTFAKKNLFEKSIFFEEEISYKKLDRGFSYWCVKSKTPIQQNLVQQGF